MKEPNRYDYKTRDEYEIAMKKYNEYESKKMMKLAFAIGGSVFAGLVALMILGGSWCTIDQGERGVVIRNGTVIGTAEPGLGFKIPLFDHVVDIDVRSQAKNL
jgi:regulator of protease activity HflC (stomatin/prohibitin superfamily)